MSSSRGGFGGIAIVLLLAVVGLAALIAAASTAPANSDPRAGSVDLTDRLQAYSANEIPERYQFHPVGAKPFVALEGYPAGPAATAGAPGPAPTDLPFGANVPVWTDARAQTRPSSATDSTGRIYVAFQNEVIAMNHDIYVSWSDDGGRTWSTPVGIAVTAADEVNPSLMVSSGDRVTVFIEQDANPNGFVYIYSTDRGSTWTPQTIGNGGLPITRFQYPSFVVSGIEVYGMFQLWCTDTACLPGSWSVGMLWDDDVSTPAGWSVLWFPQPPDIELFRPSTGFNPLTGDIVGAMEIEVNDNIDWAGTSFRYNPVSGFFSQDRLVFPPSTTFVWPSISVSGNRIVWGNQISNASLLPYSVIVASYSTNGGTSYSFVSAGQGLIDTAAVDQKYVSFVLQGTQITTGYWKNGATWYVASMNGGATFQTPARVSDNNPATAIDQPHAVSVANTSQGPIAAWHDSRDGNPNIYAASFQRYTITLDTNPASLLVRFDGGAWQTAPATAQFPAGTSHTIEGQSPQPGGTGVQYVFTQWNDGNTNDPRTISIAADTTYTASFRTQYQITVASVPAGRTISVNAAPQTAPYVFWCDAGGTAALDAPSPQAVSPTSQYRFSSWSDTGAQAHAITCDQRKTVTANFVLQWQVTIATNPAGRDVVVDSQTRTGPYVFWCDDGSAHTISAPSPQATAPGTQYRYDSWSDNLAQSHSITCTASSTITANFVLQYEITINTNPAGRAVTVDGSPQTGPYSNWWDSGSVVGLLVPSPQTVGLGSRFSFSAWSDGNVNPSRTVIADQPRVLTAVFTTEYFLTMTPTPLTTVTPGSGWHPEGDIVSISTGAPAGGTTDRWQFAGWAGDPVTSPSTQSTTITMDGPKSITANWNHQYKVDLRFAAGVPGANFTVDSVDTTAPATLWWTEGSQHTVVALSTLPPVSGTRYNFASWQPGGTNRQITVTVSGTATYTAQYTRQFQVTLAVTPTGPAVTVDTLPWSGQDLWFDEGTQHFFDANANPQPGGTGERFKFSAWSGSATSTTPSLTITMDAPKVLTATYTRQFLLTIDSPYGTPTCAPPGVAGTGGCWYDENTQAQVSVTTPVTVAGAKYRFTGWSGATSTAAPTATVTMDAPKRLTAAWAEVTFLEEFGVILGILIAVIVAVVGLVLFLLMRRRKKEPPVAAMMPPPPPMAGVQQGPTGGTKMCPACGMEIPGGATTCPVCGSAV